MWGVWDASRPTAEIRLLTRNARPFRLPQVQGCSQHSCLAHQQAPSSLLPTPSLSTLLLPTPPQDFKHAAALLELLACLLMSVGQSDSEAEEELALFEAV